MLRRKSQTLNIVIVLISAISLLLLLYYVRQRLFTQTEPIVLEE